MQSFLTLFSFLTFITFVLSNGPINSTNSANSANSANLTNLLTCANTSTCTNTSVIERFKNWFNEHKIKANNEHHINHIFENWLSNDKYIYEINAKKLSWTIGHNVYSGMNSSEFAEFMKFGVNKKLLENKTGFLRGSDLTVKQLDSLKQLDALVFNSSVLPVSVDWRTKGAVTDVKSQGSCGSCWSFSTTGSLEGIYAITHGSLVSFSEQQLVDCDNGIRKNHGCNGGLMDLAFDWISSNGGLCTEQDYPYLSGTTEKAGTCQKSCKLTQGSKISKYTDVIPNSDEAMMTALAQQPVSVAIQASQKDFQLYKSGIFTGVCGSELDHGVLLVGYGTQNNLDYYILKNSWGTSWGMSGYILIGKGIDPTTSKPYNDGAGQCGVLSEGSYPML